MISPNVKSCKILKDKFESGEEVDIKKHSVNDVAWIFKVGKRTQKAKSGGRSKGSSRCHAFSRSISLAQATQYRVF